MPIHLMLQIYVRGKPVAVTRKILVPNARTARKKADIKKAVAEVRVALKGVPLSEIKNGMVIRDRQGRVVFVKNGEDLASYKPDKILTIKGKRPSKSEIAAKLADLRVETHKAGTATAVADGTDEAVRTQRTRNSRKAVAGKKAKRS